MFALPYSPDSWASSLVASDIATSGQTFSFGSDELLFTHRVDGICDLIPSTEFAPQPQQHDGTLVVTGPGLNLDVLNQVVVGLKNDVHSGTCRLYRSDLTGMLVLSMQGQRSSDDESINDTLAELCQRFYLEGAWLTGGPTLQEPGLLLMDMDSTLIAMECIDELAKHAGVGEQVSTVTEAAMQGQLDFAESLTQRVACLAGAPESILSKVRDGVPLMWGAENLIRRLQARGWKVAIASGGFTFFADHLKQRLGLDFAISNRLEVVDGCLTGKVLGDIVDAEVKANTLKSLAARFDIPMQQTLALGDGANDLNMLGAAGLGIAYKAKPLVQQQAAVNVRHFGLDTVADFLFYR